MSVDHAALIIERGEAARRLLDNTTFQSVIDDLTNYNLSAMVAAKPGQAGAEAREYHHLMQYALTQLCVELQSRRDVGDEMARVIDRIDEEDL